MTLTLEKCARHLHTSIRHMEGTSELSIRDVAGATCDYLNGCREWAWTKTPMTSLDLVAGQTTIALPVDLTAILELDTRDGLTRGITLTTPSDVLVKTAESIGAELYFWATLVFVTPQGGTVPLPYLEVWPTPTTSEVGAILLYYRRQLQVPGGDSDVFNMPPWMEPLFVAVLRAYGKGWEEEDEATVDQRLSMIHKGPSYMAAARRDAMIQPRVGRLQNGFAEGTTGSSEYFWRDRSVGGPV